MRTNINALCITPSPMVWSGGATTFGASAGFLPGYQSSRYSHSVTSFASARIASIALSDGISASASAAAVSPRAIGIFR